MRQQTKSRDDCEGIKKCGISNALDGTEDEELWDDMDEEAADDVQPQPMESDDEVDEFDDIHANEQTPEAL